MMRTEPGVLLYKDPGKQVLELSLESNDDVSRKVVLRDDTENMETDAIISDIDLILSGENAPPATGKVPDGNDILPVDVLVGEVEGSAPGPSIGSCSDRGFPEVKLVRKGGGKMCSYAAYLRKMAAKESSDDDVFEIETPVKLLESLKY